MKDKLISGTGAGAPTTRQILYVYQAPGGPLTLADAIVIQITPNAMASKPCMRTVKHTGDL